MVSHPSINIPCALSAQRLSLDKGGGVGGLGG